MSSGESIARSISHTTITRNVNDFAVAAVRGAIPFIQATADCSWECFGLGYSIHFACLNASAMHTITNITVITESLSLSLSLNLSGLCPL